MSTGWLRIGRGWTDVRRPAVIRAGRAGAALCALVWALTSGAGTAAAAAAPGSLGFGTCIAEPLSETCGADGYGLQEPVGVAISPDGTDVYVAGAGGGAVVDLVRAADGSLSFAACYGGTDTHVDTQCTTSDDVITPVSTAVSPDGSDVYVLDEGKIDVFTRSADGSLTAAGCVGDLGQPECGTSAPGNTLYPYRFGAIAVSANGAYVLTATDDGGGGNGAVDVFARAADGALSTIGCVAASGGIESHCGSESPALAGAGSLAVSSSGNVFVGGSQAVASFKLQQPSGTLVASGCIGDAAGCTSSGDLAGADASPSGVALSPDGTTLYVAAHASGEIVELDVAGGALLRLGCVAGTAGAGCGTPVTAVCAPTGVAVSGDGADVYTLDGCSNALLTFARAAGGTLVYQGCLADTITAASCAATGPGLDSPLALAITPDDSQVIVTGQARDSVAAFTRTPNLAPEVSISSPSNGATYIVGQAVSASYACTRVSGGAPIALCAGTVANAGEVDTTRAGTRTFTVTATDISGLQTKVSVTYTVLAIGTPGSVGGVGGGGSGGSSGGGGGSSGGGGGRAGGGSGAGGSGGSGGGGASGTTASAHPGARLTLRRFTESHNLFAESRVGGAGGVPAGTVFSFVLSRPATVTLTFTARQGRHTVIIGRRVLHAHAGANGVAFRGRLAGALLAAGRYAVRAVARAKGASRASAPPLRFTIVTGAQGTAL